VFGLRRRRRGRPAPPVPAVALPVAPAVARPALDVLPGTALPVSGLPPVARPAPVPAEQAASASRPAHERLVAEIAALLATGPIHADLCDVAPPASCTGPRITLELRDGSTALVAPDSPLAAAMHGAARALLKRHAPA